MTQLFSDPALAAFQKFLKVDAATKHLRPRGAIDTKTSDLKRALARDAVMTPYTKALSNTRGDKRRMGRDEDFTPDPDTIREAVECIRESLGDDAVAEFVSALHEKWPGVYGEWNEGEEGEEGEEVVGDVPGPTPGTPRPGGGQWPYELKEEHLAGDAAAFAFDARFPDAGRIGLDTYGGGACALDNYGRPRQDSACTRDNYGRWNSIGNPPPGRSSAGRQSKTGRGNESMALDARSQNSYDAVWGHLTNRIGLLG
jgi:hypothetical protein